MRFVCFNFVEFGHTFESVPEKIVSKFQLRHRFFISSCVVLLLVLEKARTCPILGHEVVDLLERTGYFLFRVYFFLGLSGVGLFPDLVGGS